MAGNQQAEVRSVSVAASKWRRRYAGDLDSGDIDNGDFDSGDFDAGDFSIEDFDNPWHPSFERASIPPVAEKTDFGIVALARLKTIVRKISDMEAVRASNWAQAAMSVRRICVLSIGLDERCARYELRKFDALQRGLMWCAMEQLLEDIQQVKSSLCGGDIPRKNDRG